MSVILFSPDEIAQTARMYRACWPHIKAYAPKPEEMDLTLQAFHYSNVMAYCLTYSDWSAEDAGRFTDLEPVIEATPLASGGVLMFEPSKNLLLKTAKQLRSFLYNAVSNGGTDCLPEKYRETIRYAAECIVDNLSGYDSYDPWAQAS